MGRLGSRGRDHNNLLYQAELDVIYLQRQHESSIFLSFLLSFSSFFLSACLFFTKLQFPKHVLSCNMSLTLVSKENFPKQLRGLPPIEENMHIQNVNGIHSTVSKPSQFDANICIFPASGLLQRTSLSALWNPTIWLVGKGGKLGLLHGRDRNGQSIHQMRYKNGSAHADDKHSLEQLRSITHSDCRLRFQKLQGQEWHTRPY